MAALTSERPNSVLTVRRALRPLAANVKAIQGGFAACDGDGFYCPATGAATEVVVGRFTQTVDNTGGLDGAKKVEVDFLRDRLLLLLEQDAGGGSSPVTVAMRERPCFVRDDQTVCADATRGAAGITYDVVAGEGVWVEVGNRGPKGEPGEDA
jgi:hypothetical protein